MFQFDTSGSRNARFALNGAVLGSVWIVMSLRLWVRVKRTITWDDGICIFSALLFTGFCTTAILIEISRNGRQSNEFEQSSLLVSLSISGTMLYIAAIGFLKTSIALFYLRYIENSWQRYTTHATILVNSIGSIVIAVVTVLECGALPGTKAVQKTVCLPSNIFHTIDLATSISNAVTSWSLAIIPIFIIATRAQRMSMAPRICTGSILLLGGCVSVLSVIRVESTGGGYLVPLSILECGTAIIAASASTLRPLFKCLARPSSDSTYINHPGNEKVPATCDVRFEYEHTTPSKSHFSFFSEAGSGTKTWFKSLYDSNEHSAEEDSRVQRNKNGTSIRQKSIKKPSIEQVARPPLLNRTESQQYLLRNDSDFDLSEGAGRRHAGSPDLFLMYGASERHM